MHYLEVTDSSKEKKKLEVTVSAVLDAEFLPLAQFIYNLLLTDLPRRTNYLIHVADQTQRKQQQRIHITKQLVRGDHKPRLVTHQKLPPNKESISMSNLHRASNYILSAPPAVDSYHLVAV